MDMPVWLRKFCILEINKEIEAENKRVKKQHEVAKKPATPNSNLNSLYSKAKNNKPH